MVEVLKECNQEGNIIIVVEEERIRRQLEEVTSHDNRAGDSMSIRSHRSLEERGSFPESNAGMSPFLPFSELNFQFLCVGSYRVLRSAYQKLLAETEDHVVFPRDDDDKDGKSDSSEKSSKKDKKSKKKKSNPTTKNSDSEASDDEGYDVH